LSHFMTAARRGDDDERIDVPIIKYYAHNCSSSGTGARRDSTAVVPAVGDIVIWNRQLDMPYGHVGVVVGPPISSSSMIGGRCAALVNKTDRCVCHGVPIGEQNYAATLWPSTPTPTIARNLTLVTCTSSSVSDGGEVSMISLVDQTGYGMIGFIRLA
jgi:hypothetical protein